MTLNNRSFARDSVEINQDASNGSEQTRAYESSPLNKHPLKLWNESFELYESSCL